MGLTDAERARVRTPAGLEIGARTSEEIALSIMAEIVRAVRAEGAMAPTAVPFLPPVQAVDPICGMTVVVDLDTPHLVDADGDHWFCGTGCRDHYLAEHREHAGHPVQAAHTDVGR